jgi:hypothetical protein
MDGAGDVFRRENHRVFERTIYSPNDEFFNLDETWNWGITVTGELPAAL